jgi:aerobic carbon-monoxide dehydrogenase medium subunit
VKPPPFEYHAPTTFEAAVSLLGELEDEDAKCLAGGQSLVPLMNLRLARPGHLVDLNRVSGGRGIERTADGWRFGALTRHADVEDSAELAAEFPLLPQVARQIAYRAIRTRGTLGGAVCHADPVAEWPMVVRMLDAELEVVGPGGARTIPASEFFYTVFTPAIEPDEILRTIHIRLPRGSWTTGFAEFARKVGDYAIVAAGVLLELDGDTVSAANVGLSGVALTPHRSEAAESALEGTEVGDAAAHRRAADAAAEAVSPSTDLHASSDFRRQLVRTQLVRALDQAARTRNRM